MSTSSSWQKLVTVLADDGQIAPEWVPVFEELPRTGFLPDLIWKHNVATKTVEAADRARDPKEWLTAAESGAPLVTQWDDGKHQGTGRGQVASSSASAPSVVASMLRDLDVRPGQRVLEIGTGTGWNAGLLARRLGVDRVTTIEVDKALAEAARAALSRHGLEAAVVCGDGFLGHPPGAPYDRIIATCGISTAFPDAWLGQCRRGGVIVLPWGTPFTHTEATVALTVAQDGRSASGHFTKIVQFMSLRAQRREHPAYEDYVTAESRENADKSITALTLEETLGGEWDINRFALGLLVPDSTVIFDKPKDGRHPVWLCGLTDRSWACVLFREDGQHAAVFQYGDRRLWDEVAIAHEEWVRRDRPGLGRLGLTIHADGDGPSVWSDSPDNAFRLHAPV
ncbi:methyltransferase domain-containing protein [Streptomyces klenkii]|uniref:methyltransferase domain-containing protein n=1 Tax=Streptomyces klenkii TaxID=1420899 RepID=UPI00344AE230